LAASALSLFWLFQWFHTRSSDARSTMSLPALPTSSSPLDRLRRGTTLLDRDTSARRLLRTAERHTLYPDVEIDWDAPVPADAWCVPEHRSSLYGTPLWEQMTDQQRRTLTRHEVASIAGLGIWFETILMQMLLRHLYLQSSTDAHSRFTLTEIADECRHSLMFGRMIQTLGCPEYGPGRLLHRLGRLFKTVSNPTVTFAGTLYVEEILDAFQREAMQDGSVTPLVRQVSRLHVIEEARHIAFARQEAIREYARLGAAARLVSRLVLVGVAYGATVRLIHPRCYAAAGVDPQQAWQQARANPYWQRTKQDAAARVLDFYEQQGMVGRLERAVLRQIGLLAA